MKVTGDYINYSMTVLDNAPQKEEAIDFLCFIISGEGLEIFQEEWTGTYYSIFNRTA